jgi:Protein tyrosine phosphatase-like protein, PTPLA
MTTIKDAYLILYNNALTVAWAMVWCIAAYSVVTEYTEYYPNTSMKEALSQVYFAGGLALMLDFSQSMALLEIVHAATGLVRSPVMVTFMQVSSRIVALFALVASKEAQRTCNVQSSRFCVLAVTSKRRAHIRSGLFANLLSFFHVWHFALYTGHWGAGLMILSWASVEVPRYAFYVAALVTGDSNKKTPYPLFWLRYSLFAVLYPTGIAGELMVFFAAAYDPKFVEMVSPAGTIFYARVLPAIYVLGSPFMIYNMILNRKSAFKKRYARAPPPPRGLSWPKDKKGERSSTDTNKAIVAAAVGAVNATKRDAILACKKWRFQYTKHLAALVEEQCASPEAALAIAQAGLDKAYDLFEFIAPDGSAQSLRSAMEVKNTESFFTGFVKGTKAKDANLKLEVPYKGTKLSGQALKDQIQKWVDYGTIEPSAGQAMMKCADNPAWLTDLSNRYFVLLGAGSAMGPLLVLMALGANVIAIDLDRPFIWKRLIGIARESSGTMTFPLKIEQSKCLNDETLYDNAGCNLFTHTPMIRDWLVNLYPFKPFTVGSYAYLDGALHVQVSLAMDAICRDLSEKRPNTSLAYLCTPTDLHLIPKEAHDEQVVNYKVYSKKLYCMLLRLINPKLFLRKNPKNPVVSKGGETFYMVNGISVAQGPNYALAKRMQHWRAIIARNKAGCIVSSNIAPSTSTASVVHNRTFAWAYEGMPYFKPYEIFAPETSNAVMSAILLYDLNDPASAGNPKTTLPVNNPNQLFSYGAFHGGVWRCAYEIDSIGEASVFLYFGRLAAPYVYGVTALIGAGIAIAVATKS